MLQRKTRVNLSDIRILFDSLVSKFLNVEHHFGPKTEIIQSTVFENAVVKIIDGRIAELTQRLKSTRKVLEITNEVVGVDGNLEFAENILRAKRAYGVDDVLMNLEWLPLTTNRCERLYSREKLSIGCLRHGLSFRAIPLCEESFGIQNLLQSFFCDQFIIAGKITQNCQVQLVTCAPDHRCF